MDIIEINKAQCYENIPTFLSYIGHIIVNANINGTFIKAIIDTGCSKSIMFRNTAKLCGIADLIHCNIILSVGINIYNNTYINDFHINDDTHQIFCDVLLGSDFISTHDLKIDFSNNIITTPQFCEPIQFEQNIKCVCIRFVDKCLPTLYGSGDILFDNKKILAMETKISNIKKILSAILLKAQTVRRTNLSQNSHVNDQSIVKINNNESVEQLSISLKKIFDTFICCVKVLQNFMIFFKKYDDQELLLQKESLLTSLIQKRDFTNHKIDFLYNILTSFRDAMDKPDLFTSSYINNINMIFKPKPSTDSKKSNIIMQKNCTFVFSNDTRLISFTMCPTIYVFINKKQYIAFIDTGASKCSINNAVINDAGLTKFLDIHTIDYHYSISNNLETFGEICNKKSFGKIWYVNMIIGNYAFPCSFKVVEMKYTFKFDIIIGLDFLVTYNAVINSRDRFITFNDEFSVKFL